MRLLVFQDVVGNASSDLFCFLVLAKVVHKLALWVYQIHDDSVVHLRGGVKGCGKEQG